MGVYRNPFQQKQPVQILPVAAAPAASAQPPQVTAAPPTPRVNTKGYAGETYEDMIARQAADIKAGRRSFNDIRNSLDIQAGRAPQDYSQINDAGHDPVARLRAMHENRGLAGKAKPGERPAEIPISVDEFGRVLGQESQRMFQDENAGDISFLLNAISKGQMSTTGALEHIRQGSGGINDLNRRAGMAASVELDPQLIAYEQLARERQLESDHAQQELTRLGAGTEQRQKQMYDALAAYLAGEGPQSASIYDTAQGNSDAAYDHALGSIQTGYQNAIAGTSAEAERLGLSAATPEATAGMSQDQQFLAGLLQSQKLGANSTLENYQMSDANALQSLARSSAVEGTNVRAGTAGDFSLRRSDEILDRLKDLRGYSTEAKMLEATRRGKVYEGVQSLRDAREAAMRDAEQQAWERQLAESELGVKLNDSETKRYAAETDRAAVEIQAKKTNAELEKIMRENTPGSIEYETAAAAIRLKDAQAAAAVTNSKTGIQNANINQQNADTKRAEAERKAQEEKDKKPYGKGMGGVTEFMNDSNLPAARKSDILHATHATFIKYPQDYGAAARELDGRLNSQEGAGWSTAQKQAARRALQIMYGVSQ